MLKINRFALLQGFVAVATLISAPYVFAQALLGTEAGHLRAASIIEFLAVAPSATQASTSDSTTSAERGIAGVRSSHAARTDKSLASAASVSGTGVTQQPTPPSSNARSEIKPATNKPGLFLARRRAGRSQIRFDNIPFNERSFSIPFDAYAQLDEIGVALATLTKRFPTTQFILESYAGNAGSESADKKLSTLRAKSIKRFLVARFALDSSRLAVVGLGSDQRNLGVKTTNHRELNRIVQLVRIL